MTEELWTRRPPPPSGPDTTVLGRWAPATLAQLTAHRRRLADQLHTDMGLAHVDEGAVERLLLAYEELGSNALRHGGAPIRILLTADDRYWLLVVSDTAADQPPTPAVDRDPSLGGLGLHLIARVSGAHGWAIGADGAKHVWARIDHTLAEAPAHAWRAVPRPRSPRSPSSRDG